MEAGSAWALTIRTCLYYQEDAAGGKRDTVQDASDT